ncbi:hypothetical protein [Methylocystis sp. S23]
MSDTFKVYDFDPRNLPQELLSAIGLMAASTAQTEHIVEMAIHCFLGVDIEYGQAITSHMSMPQRLNCLMASAEIRIDDIESLVELEEIVEKIESSFNLRNAVIHHTWCVDPETDQISTVKTSARGTVKTDFVHMTVDKVKADALVVYAAGISLMEFLIAREFRQTLPPIGRQRGHKTKAARKIFRKNRLDGSGRK